MTSESALQLETMGLKLIGVVRTATRPFPVAYLSQLPFEKHRDSVALAHLDKVNKVDMISAIWLNREKRYIIATAS